MKYLWRLRTGVEHNALHDAMNQARCVGLAMRKLKDIRNKADRYESCSK